MSELLTRLTQKENKMAHEIEENKAFFTGQPAWHGLGHVLSTAPNVHDAWKLAYPHVLFKLDCEAVVKSDDGSIHRMPSETCKIIMRDDGKELGHVGSDFELIQPHEVFKQFEPMINSGQVELEAGGSLREGKQMWALGKIKGAEADVLPGDPVKGYFLMYTGFEGSLRVGMTLTNTRVVCANTLALAMYNAGTKNKAGESYRFKHTKKVRIRMDDARNAISESVRLFQESVGVYRQLATKRMARNTQEVMIEKLFLTEAEQKQPDLVSTKKANIVQEVIELLDTQKGLDLVPAVKGTAWQAYNAVTEYTTHRHGRNTDTRLQAQWFGDSKKVNNEALQMALAM